MSNPFTICIYHRADFDGIFCREIAKRFLPSDTQFIGWDYGDPIPEVKIGEVLDGVNLYMLDISVEGLMYFPGLIWIDHHKSAIEKYDPLGDKIYGYRIDGVAACRLAWQYFTIQQYNAQHQTNEQMQVYLPLRQDYVDRIVSEPWAVKLAGEYDIWDKRDPRSELFQHGLRSCELTPEIWDMLLSHGMGNEGRGEAAVQTLLNNGYVIQYAKNQEDASIITTGGFTVQWEGFTFLCCNTARFNSHLFTAGLKPEHDALLGFKYEKDKWRVSLYHAPGKEHHDLSLIAVKMGGGGHRGACGFEIKDYLSYSAKYPFLFSPS